MDIAYRPRRLRRTPGLRAMVREHHVSAADFIYPLFVHEGASNESVSYTHLTLPTSRWV